MIERIDEAMLRGYLKISGGLLFVLLFILGYLYYIYPNPIILLNLSLMIILELIGFEKINMFSEIKSTTKIEDLEPESHKPVDAEGILSAMLPLRNNPGFIYVMIRNDGIYKIGHTTNTARRLTEHIKDYNKSFTLVRRFVVPDAMAFETIALQITADYYHEEQHRKELRTMTDAQLSKFLVGFEKICRKAVTL